MQTRTILAHGAIFEIAAQDGVVTCEVINRPNVTAEEGARCASQINDVLTTLVLTPFSAYQGLLFDVRQGPPAFGPKTRAALERVFAAASASKRRMAVLVGSSATQRMQFGNLCQEHAPEHARVFMVEQGAREWLAGPT